MTAQNGHRPSSPPSVIRVCSAGILVAALSLDALATTTPEVPAQRTTQIFSPFFFDFADNGEGVLQTGGPKKQGYWVTHGFVFDQDPDPVHHTGSLLLFLQLMESPAGILFTSSHGGTDNIMVEVYPNTPEGRAAGLTAFASYVDPQTGVVESHIDPVSGNRVSNEIGLYETEAIPFITPSYFGIGVRPAFFTNRLTAQHGLMLGLSCNSFPLGSTIVGGHNVRDFVGVDDEIKLPSPASHGALISQAIFDNMSGVDNDLGSYRNASILETIPLAQAKLAPLYPAETIPIVKLQKDPGPGADPANLRLYNAPRIVLSQVLEDPNNDAVFDRLVYKYVIGNDVYPYDRTPSGARLDYPTGGSTSKNIATGGPLEVTLRFSEPMNIIFGNFHAKILPPGGGSPISIPSFGSNSGWSSVRMPSPTLFDTWRGRVELPAGFPDGEVRIEVRASKDTALPGLDTGNQELDLDGNGFSSVGALDTSVSFRIADRDFSTRIA